MKNATWAAKRSGNAATGKVQPAERRGAGSGSAPRGSNPCVPAIHSLAVAGIPENLNRYDNIDAPTISLFCGETRCRWQNSTIMKNTSHNKLQAKRADGLRPEYHFDYAKAKPNRFAGRVRPGSVVILLDPDVARVVAEWQIAGGKKRPPALPRDPKTTHRNRR